MVAPLYARGEEISSSWAYWRAVQSFRFLKVPRNCLLFKPPVRRVLFVERHG